MWVEKQYVPEAEQETVISIDHATGRAHVYSSYKPTIAKLQKFAEESEEEVIVLIDDSYGMSVSIPKDWIKMKQPRKKTEYSEEAKQQLCDRLQAARDKRWMK